MTVKKVHGTSIQKGDWLRSLGRQGVDRMTILKEILKVGHVVLDCIHLAVDGIQQWTVYEHENKPSCISDYELLMNQNTPSEIVFAVYSVY